jgi:hypothetical protein
MIEVPQWFLIVIGVVTFAAAHRRRKGLLVAPAETAGGE